MLTRWHTCTRAWTCGRITRMDMGTTTTTTKNNPPIDWLRIAIHVIGLARIFQLVVLWLLDDLTANPIQFIEQRLGRTAILMLLLTLAVTPLVTLAGWKQIGRFRKTLGMYAFLYFGLHFLTFAVFDYQFNLGEILRLMIEKPFILAGVAAGIILALLAITTAKYWKKRLGKNWKTLHRLVYLAGILAMLHYLLAQKGALGTGNILMPVIGFAVLAVLLVVRVPIVKDWLISLKR